MDDLRRTIEQIAARRSGRVRGTKVSPSIVPVDATIKTPFQPTGSVMSGVFATESPRLYEAGLNVVPVIPGLKQPFVKWARWQNTRQSADEFRDLREAFPKAWVAAVLGPGSGFVDIEADSAEGEWALLALDLPLPQTEMWRSKRGPHRLYRHRQALRFHKGNGFEVRTHGLSVVPPSGSREWLTAGDPRKAAELAGEWVKFLSPTTTVPSLVTCFPSCTAPSLVTCFPSLEIGSGEFLREVGLKRLFADLEVVRAVAAVLGISGEVNGAAFHCVLPGHGRAPGVPELRPSATLCTNSQGVVVYHDWHRRDDLEYLTLPEVRAALASGEVRRLRPPELATWGLRLLVEARVLEPVHIDAPALPDWVAPFICAVDDGFRLLLGCKWLYAPGKPTAFSWRFAAAWCDVSQKQAGQAIQHLCHEGRIRRVDRSGPMALFLPG